MRPVDILRNMNLWWETGKISDSFLSIAARDEYRQIESLMNTRRVLAVVGPRRTGKSTLIYQTIDSLLKSGVNPAHILLFTGDTPGIYGGGETISDIINLYVDELLHKSLNEIKSRVYVFIDEIHFIKGWQIEIKSLYDLNPRLKFVISGSSSIQMFYDAKESLLGRITDIYVLPLAFDQFLRFSSLLKDAFDYSRYTEAIPGFSVFEDPAAYYRQLADKKIKLSFMELALNKTIKAYLLNGGYPEYFSVDLLRPLPLDDKADSSGDSIASTLYWQRVLADDIISKGLYRDIVSFYRVTSPMLLERLLYIIAGNNGGEYAYAGLGNSLNIDTTTAMTYSNYLAQAYLVNILENYSPNFGKIVRKNKKIYVADNGIRNALLRSAVISSTEEGHLAETACVQLARSCCEVNLFGLYYWRDKQQEVDLVIDKKTSLLPVEVKYRNQIQEKDIKGLRTFMDKFGAKTGLVITRNTLQESDGVYYIPLRLIR